MECIRFNTNKEANAFIKNVNSGEGFPVANGLTKSYCKFINYEGGIYIKIDSVIEKYISNENIVNIEFIYND
jgi:hypothetical protein